MGLAGNEIRRNGLRGVLWTRWPTPLDVAIFVVLQSLNVLGPLYWGQSWFGTLLGQPAIILLLWRRRHPNRVFAVAAAFELFSLLIGVETGSFFPLLIALYSVAAHRERRDALLAALVFLGIILLTVDRFAPPDSDFLVTTGLLTGTMLAGLFLGTTLRAQRQYLTSLRDRAERMERERDQQAQLATTAERTRIAREMHDIVAHSLSVVIRLADGAVATSRTDPGTAVVAMEQVATTGRQALAEMRQLLGVLRDDQLSVGGADRAPQPDIRRLDQLVEEVRATGLPVSLGVTGTPLILPALAEATIYRIVQEGLTNVLKHADRPTRANVTMAWADRSVEITVRDDGIGRRGTAEGPGQGLRGVRERVALFDGSLSSGPSPPRGWQMRAVLRFREVAV